MDHRILIFINIEDAACDTSRCWSNAEWIFCPIYHLKYKYQLENSSSCSYKSIALLLNAVVYPLLVTYYEQQEAFLGKKKMLLYFLHIDRSISMISWHGKGIKNSSWNKNYSNQSYHCKLRWCSCPMTMTSSIWTTIVPTSRLVSRHQYLLNWVSPVRFPCVFRTELVLIKVKTWRFAVRRF